MSVGGTATTTNGVSRDDGFVFNFIVAELGQQQQAIKGGDDKEGFVLVATDENTIAYSKQAIRTGDIAQIPARDGNNPEKEGKEEAEQDKDDNTRV